MSFAKRELFDRELQDASDFFKVLSHPARLAILKYLAGTKTCITGALSDELPLSRTTVNQHLRELSRLGLVQGTISGVKTNYCLNPTRIEAMKNRIEMFLNGLESATNLKCES